MSQTVRKAGLEAQMLVARGMAAAMGAGKKAQLDALIAEHGGPENVPEEKLIEWMGPMDEVAKSIRLTTALMNLSKRFGLPMLQTKTARAVGLFINARLTDPEYYDPIKELHDGPDEKIRPGMYRLMLRLGDLTQRKVDWELATPEKKAAFEAWLNGELGERDEFDPKAEDN